MNTHDLVLDKRSSSKYNLEIRKQYIEKWKLSKLTRSEFCRREGLQLQTFCYWVNKYKSKEITDKDALKPSLEPTMPFVSLGRKALPSSALAKPQIEIVLPNGLSCVLKFCDDISWVVKIIEGLSDVLSHQK